jgi:CheY-like chemotaxis protein
LQYILQVLESRQRALHFFDQLAGEDIRCPDLLLLDYTLPGLDTRELLQWMRAVPACRWLRMVVMTGSDDPAVQAEALALGADAFFQKPVGFQRFLALGDLIKAVVFGIRRPPACGLSRPLRCPISCSRLIRRNCLSEK